MVKQEETPGSRGHGDDRQDQDQENPVGQTQDEEDEDASIGIDDGIRRSWRRISGLHRTIILLQDALKNGNSLDDWSSESTDLEDPENEHIDLRLNECLTKSRFYIPAPGWTETQSPEVSLGIGPREMEPGDQIAILFGCKQPVILRAKDSSLGVCRISLCSRDDGRKVRYCVEDPS